MASADPDWYCPRCNTISPYRKKYCSNCEGHVMLFFNCPSTNIDDYYTNFTTRHLPLCTTCTQYQQRLDESTRKNRALHTKALSDTTQGIRYTLTLLLTYCNTLLC